VTQKRLPHAEPAPKGAIPSRWFQPTLADLLGGFLVVLVVLVGGSRLFGDSDPAWHVATGNWILEHRRAPLTDPFSATHAGGEWFAYEWLSDITFALAHRFAGWSGLVVMSASLIAGSHVLLYRSLVGRGDVVLVSFFAVLVAAASASSHWLARPHLLAVLLLVVWATTLDGVVEGRCTPWRLAALPPLAVVWTNLHGSFLLSLGTLASYWAGNFLAARPGRFGEAAVTPRAERARALAGPLTATIGATLAAVTVNPWGWRLPAHILAFFTVRRPHLASIEEFAPPSMEDRAGLASLFLLILGAVGIACGARALFLRRRGKVDRTDTSSGCEAPLPHPGLLLAFGMGALLALTSIRHVEVAAIFGAMVLSHGVSALARLKADSKILATLESWRRYETRHGGAGFVSAVLVVALLARTAGWPEAGFDPARFPVKMVTALKEAGVVPSGPVFTPDWWGGYLILEWPQARVFVDGRSDMYGDAFLERYAALYTAGPDWQTELVKAGVNWALLPLDAPLGSAMRADPGWILWRGDSTTLVFQRVISSSP